MSPKFDLQKTQDLVDLFSIPKEARDDSWRKGFFKAVPDASLRAKDPQVFLGPDGFPYFFLALPLPAQSFTPFCMTHILDFCVQKGVGTAVFGNDEQNPEWVFSYGDLISYKFYGSFEGDPSDERHDGQPPWKETVQANRKILMGSPAPEFFPPETRQVVKGFLQSNGIPGPGVTLIMDPTLKPTRNLVFNFFTDDFKTEEVYHQLMQKLTWFFPRGRGVLGMERSAVQNWKFELL
jgi:hypothetical protein